MKGRFIVIDGSDGSGKGTQSEILITRLKSDGYETAYYDFPQYYDTFFGKMIGEFLTGKFGRPDIVNPYMASLLYAGDRWQASRQMKKDLDAGKVVISNRYTSSNMAHQAGKIRGKRKKEEFLKWLLELEFNTYNIPKPDLVLYLYVPLEVSQKLLETKVQRQYVGKREKDKVEKSVKYLSNSIKEYVRLAEIYPEWQKIDCTKKGAILSVEEIGDMIFDNVSPLLSVRAVEDNGLEFETQTI